MTEFAPDNGSTCLPSTPLLSGSLEALSSRLECGSQPRTCYSNGSLTSFSAPARIVKLNVGGFKFHTTVATLTKYPDTFFTALLSEKMPTARDEEGAYFIDRDGQFFAPVLIWLRTNEISLPPGTTRDDLLREAIFFSIQPLVEELTLCASTPCEDEGEIRDYLKCPLELVSYVTEYWSRHECTIMNILKVLNREGHLSITAQIIPGHRQDFERPPQLLENGKLGLYMNFTSLSKHIAKYAHVQLLLAKHFRQKGLTGYFRSGEHLELWWNDHTDNIKRKHDIVYF